jgi:uncharacterized protein YyaL (SSP411 family)
MDRFLYDAAMTMRTAILAKCSGVLLLSLMLSSCGSDEPPSVSEAALDPSTLGEYAASDRAVATEATKVAEAPTQPTAPPTATADDEPDRAQQLDAITTEPTEHIVPAAAVDPGPDVTPKTGGWRLADAASPYLRQHADNPVEWYPWGDEAFAAAKAEDKLIFLSIGYSSCHWCHRMEHDTFLHEGVARKLSESFISIKVDREERPDVDNRYMTALQIISEGRGGWPISLFLTPDGHPITGGTYFPAEDTGRMPGFLGVLDRLNELWADKHDEVVEAAGKFGAHLQKDRLPAPGTWDSKLTLDMATTQQTGMLDSDWGGSHSAPKFPASAQLQFLLRQHLRSGVTVIDLVRTTLDRMASGGMHDHVGGGFHRYSTDAKWQVPHFEKMLYDNAQLALTYAEAYAQVGADEYAHIARRTLAWLMGDMRSPEGLYYSARDADSAPYDENDRAIEGEFPEEGLFYLWTPAQLRAVLGEQDGASFARLFKVTDDGNFEGGASIVRPMRTLGDLASDPGDGLPSGKAFMTWLDAAFAKLAAARAERPPAFRDEKCLAGWNGLTLSALARTGALLDDPALRDEAASLASSLHAALIQDGEAGMVLKHVHFEGHSAGEGDLFDHASVARGLLDAFEACGDPLMLTRAIGLTHAMLDRFEDTEDGGFFDTQGLDPNLPGQTRDVLDNAVPAGNSVAVEVLVRLSALDDSGRFEGAARRALDRVGPMAQQNPRPFAALLAGIDAWHGPLVEIVLDGSGPEYTTMLRHVRTTLLPAALLIPDASALADAFDQTPSLLADRVAPEGEARAWVCVKGACLAPAKDTATLIRQLKLLQAR